MPLNFLKSSEAIIHCDAKNRLWPLPLPPPRLESGLGGEAIVYLFIFYLFWQYWHSSRLGANVGTYTDGASVSFAYAQSLYE